jgi:hypothetical protein
MNKLDFEQWLQDDKNMSVRSARDVLSRKKRVEYLLGIDSFDDNTLVVLLENEDYQDLSIYIRSQLKRAVSLVLEYQDKING